MYEGTVNISTSTKSILELCVTYKWGRGNTAFFCSSKRGKLIMLVKDSFVFVLKTFLHYKLLQNHLL